MKEILKKLFIEDFIIVLIVFSILIIIASIIYGYLFLPNYVITIPLPNNTTYNMTITNYDIISAYFNGLKNNINSINFNNKEKVEEFINRSNYLIFLDENNTYVYRFYAERFNILYPNKVFVLCLVNNYTSCSPVSFTYVGLYTLEESVIDLNKTLILFLDENFAYYLLDLLYNKKDDVNYFEIIKEGLKKGKIKVNNQEILVKNIVYYHYNLKSVSNISTEGNNSKSQTDS